MIDESEFYKDQREREKMKRLIEQRKREEYISLWDWTCGYKRSLKLNDYRDRYRNKNDRLNE